MCVPGSPCCRRCTKSASVTSNHPMHTPTASRVRLSTTASACLLFAFATLAGLAQTTPAPDEKVVVLDTFQVSTSISTYAQQNSSTGSKVPVQQRDLPATVQVMNASFIGDLRAQTTEDIYPYVIGMSRGS